MESLEALESKIRKAVELVSELRAENAKLRRQLADAESAAGRSAEMARETEALRSEREIVRRRLEKLLEAIDQVNAA
jgi:FtsZ-binding cell division protein ZapB